MRRIEMKRYGALILTMILATATFASTAQEASKSKAKNDKANNSPAQAKTPAPPAAAAGSEDPKYVIGAEDMLDINIWKEPEVSRTVQVRPDGKISLPLLNDVQAVGLKPTELAAQITEKLKKYLTDPQVTVIVTAINSRRVYISGEVNRGGAYPLLPNMTVLQALAGAGGFSQFANQKNIYVMRVEEGKQVKLPFNYRKVVKGEQPDIILKPGDTIVVP
jgi:polysaccharide export outer membrane protein